MLFSDGTATLLSDIPAERGGGQQEELCIKRLRVYNVHLNPQHSWELHWRERVAGVRYHYQLCRDGELFLLVLYIPVLGKQRVFLLTEPEGSRLWNLIKE